MKHIAFLLAGISAYPAFAQSTAKDTYVSGAIGAISFIGLVLVVGIYKLGKLLVLQLRPTSSLAIQRLSGASLVIASFMLLSLFGK